MIGRLQTQITYAIEDLYNTLIYSQMMINTRATTALENQRFRQKLEASMPNYAYEVLLLEIIVEDDLYPRKPTIEEITKLTTLYMLAVEVLEGAADCRYDYFKRKIHSLMLKKHIVQQMHFSRGQEVTKETIQECERAELEKRKYEHQAQVYFNKTDNSKVQQILKKAQIQVRNLNTNLRKNIISQEQKLEERIKNRKMKSESGSVHKYKIGSHNAQAKDQDTPPRRNQKIDPRMDYFDDYADAKETKPIGTAKNIRTQYGSIQKADIPKAPRLYPI